MRRLALGRQVGGRGHHHAPHLPDLMRDERGIVEPADAHAQIYALFQQIHLAVRQHQAAAHLVVLPDKAIQRRRHVHLAEQHRRRDRQLAGEFPGVFAQRRFGLFQGRQHMAAAIQVAQALIGERDAPRAAVEQPHAQVGFQRRQRAHHCRQGRAQYLRGGGQAALFRDAYECRHAFQLVHQNYPSSARVKFVTHHLFQVIMAAYPFSYFCHERDYR